ncbi:MAG: SRPBCC family protein, partial [Pseudomonadota bacterium]
MKFTVEKSTTINAPLSKVRPLIEDFSAWNSWSPWTVIEPDCKIDVKGKAGEPGHSMQWEGEIIGSGRNTVKN